MAGYAPKLPLAISEEDGAYGLLKDIRSVVKQNLKSLLLTSPGERVMDNNFGVGLRHVLFEPNVGVFHDKLKTRIMEQIAKYMPFLQVDSLEVSKDSEDDFREDGTVLRVHIEYQILPVSVFDILSITVTQ